MDVEKRIYSAENANGYKLWKNIQDRLNEWCINNDIEFYGTYHNIQVPKTKKALKVNAWELMNGLDILEPLDLELQEHDKIVYFFTDNLVDQTNLQNIKVISVPELFGLTGTFECDYPTEPTKLFNCFMQRIESVRQSWFYFFKHFDLLDKGYVSFTLLQDAFHAGMKPLEIYDYNHKNYKLGNLEHFEKAYYEMRPHVPYKNFEEKYDLAGYLSDSKYTVSLESFACEDNHFASAFTEKIQRALQFPTINLIFAQQNSMTKLQKRGFAIPDFMLEVDQYPWQRRQQMLLEILTKDTEQFSAESLYNNAIHNQNIMHQYYKKLHDESFYEEIFDTVVA